MSHPTSILRIVESFAKVRPEPPGGAVTTMAMYKYGNYLQQNNHSAFDSVHTPGTGTPDSGIYRCEACGDEVASNKGNPLPPQNHHQHSPGLGAIRWRL